MGRGGGSSGGGNRSFGGGGNRSFGGRAGGGNTGRGGGNFGGGGNRGSGGMFNNGSPRGGNIHPPPMHHHHHHGPSIHHHYGMPRMFSPGWGSSHRRSPGCGTGCLTYLFILIVISLVLVFAFIPSNNSITKSTIERIPLPKDSVVEKDYYTDELDWIKNKTKLLAGMKNFYNKTGVQPHLYITDTINGTHYPKEQDASQYAAYLYDSLFSDEAHLLLIFFEYEESKYHTWYLCGNQAKTVIDSEAADILLDYVDKYYYEDLSDDEFFSKAFDEAGNRIMKVTVSPWVNVGVILGILGILVIMFIWWSRYKKQKNLEASQTEEILRAPLNTFDSEMNNIENKYKD